MNFIKKLFGKKIPKKIPEAHIEPGQTPCPNLEGKKGGYDLDDKGEVASEEAVIDSTVPSKVESAVKKKPGRPKGSTSKKTPSKKTPAKKTPSKKS
jgi:hypothetical protein